MKRWRGIAAVTFGLLIVVLVLGLAAGRRPPLELAPGTGGEAIAVTGRPLLLKASLRPSPGHRFVGRWDFGDGSPQEVVPVANPEAFSLSHVYAGGAGAAFVASLAVTDVTTREALVATCRVRVVSVSRESLGGAAVDDALWALEASEERWEDPVDGSLGCWDSATPERTADTALAALAFEVHGSPRREPVERALRFLLRRCVAVKIALAEGPNPDSNGNGIGITIAGSARPLYEVPLVLLALVASEDPGRVATSGPEGVFGRTYREIVQDMLDFLVFAQCRAENGSRGGWRYAAPALDADMSVTQWPVLACLAARELWGLETPPWVAHRLEKGFLAHDQAPDGGFGYTGPGENVSVRLTAAGLLGLRFVGAPGTDARVRRAVQYIADHWRAQNVGDVYSMYAVMKAASLGPGAPLERFGEHDWRREYEEWLVAHQRRDGTWPEDNYAKGARATAWPALVLSRGVLAAARGDVRPRAPAGPRG